VNGLSFYKIICKGLNYFDGLSEDVCVCGCLSGLLIFTCLRKIAKSDYWLRHICLSVCPSFRLSAWNSAATGRVFITFYIRGFFSKIC
jgi:hypothetical protein